MKKIRVIDLFAGIGGFHSAFNKKDYEVVFASEIDKYPSEVYKENYKIEALSDITKVDEKEVPEHEILCSGFPCQAFSIAGKRKGFEDTRGTLFFDVARIINHHKPKIVFLENVKGLVNHDKGRTLDVILKTLDDLGYNVYHEVLNTYKHGGIPHNRERIYIVGFRKDLNVDSYEFPKEIPLKEKFLNFIDRNQKVDDKYYYDKRFKIWPKLKDEINSMETAYQWRRKYVRENKNNICPTLTANMGTGGHNVPLIRDNYGIRKLTPQECLRLQGFNSLKIPKEISDSRIYKMAGNSVSVPVIKRIVDSFSRYLK